MTGASLSLPDSYPQLLAELKTVVRTARIQAYQAANSELVMLYWHIGRAIVLPQQAEGWGTRVIDRLAADLRAELPHMSGLSRRNLVYMRTLATAYPEEITQQAVARLPWGHVTVLLDKLDARPSRDWYANAAVEHGWSRNVLAHQIATQLHTRAGASPSNFAEQLPAADSDLAQQLVRDPYVFDFLDLTERVSERELETALMNKLQAFLLELGHGLAFVGRQYHVEVDGTDFYLDLLFFNWVQSRFVVLELKIGPFRPEYVGQLGFYVAWADANLRKQGTHAPTVGILLCAGRNDNVVRYTLARATAPLAVADYTYDALPQAIREAVPSSEELGSAISGALSGDGTLTAGTTSPTQPATLCGDGTLTNDSTRDLAPPRQD